MKNINSSHNNKPPEKSRPKYKGTMKTVYNFPVYNNLVKEHRTTSQSTITWMKKHRTISQSTISRIKEHIFTYIEK